MNHEKIFNRPDGSKVKVTARFNISSYSYSPNGSWDFSVATCAPRKRTWVNVISTDDYGYRALNMTARKDFERAEGLKVATPEEVNETMFELWESLKPTPVLNGNQPKEDTQ